MAHEYENFEHGVLPTSYCYYQVGPGMYVICLDQDETICRKIVISHGTVHLGQIFECTHTKERGR
jgi:hypothetical protein